MGRMNLNDQDRLLIDVLLLSHISKQPIVAIKNFKFIRKDALGVPLIIFNEIQIRNLLINLLF